MHRTQTGRIAISKRYVFISLVLEEGRVFHLGLSGTCFKIVILSTRALYRVLAVYILQYEVISNRLIVDLRLTDER